MRFVNKVCIIRKQIFSVAFPGFEAIRRRIPAKRISIEPSRQTESEKDGRVVEERVRQIVDDLRDVVTGDVWADDLTRAAYSTDASVLQVRPTAVVCPRSTEEIAAVVRYAAENNLPIHPRGAGTGVAGESLGTGLMLDVTRHMHQIVSRSERSVRVQPGVRCVDLDRFLAGFQRRFAPDPFSGDRCTIGGMIGTDAAGPRSLRYGTTADHVQRLKLVLADGSIVDVGHEPADWWFFGKQRTSSTGLPTSPELSGENDPLRRLVPLVAEILKGAASAIDDEQPATLRKSGGYRLRGALRHGILDLPRLMCGSEGTLAIVAEAELNTLPTPGDRGVLLAFFPSMETAVQAAIDSLEFQPTACELLDRRLLSLAREARPEIAKLGPDRAEAMLLVEQEGFSTENVENRIRRMTASLKKLMMPGVDPIPMLSKAEQAQAWQLRTAGLHGLTQHSGESQPIPIIENTAVPPANLPAFFRAVQEIMRRFGITASYTAHAGLGILHTRPLIDLKETIARVRLDAIVNEVHDAALALGGTFHGEHGIGLLRSGQVAKQFPKLYPVFCRIKAAFDPHNTLNPGKIVGAEPRFPIDSLRIPASVRPDHRPPTPLLIWSELPLAEHANRCNGCGSCRTGQDSVRMCPTFKVMETELAAPRSKANLMRQIVYGDLDAKTLSSEEFRTIADYCVQCKMCRVECPSEVDISKLMLEAKAANVAEHGMSRTDWFFANLESWSNFASRHASPINHLLANRAFRWIAEKAVGLARDRKIVRFHRKTFLRRAAQFGWTKRPRKSDPSAKVALLVDTFPNVSNPHLVECAARVLEKLGRKIYVPPNQRDSGLAALQHGELDLARECVRSNIEAFAELAREGYDIVSTEPSAVLMFRNEARGLVADPDLDLLARQTFEFSEYMARIAAEEKFPDDLQEVPLTVAYHEPCHQRALYAGPHRPALGTADLLRRIPKLHVVGVDLGCSGMAGTYGMRADSFSNSLRAGEVMLHRLKRTDIHLGVTQCSACRMQIEQGAGKRTLHPAELLALSFGVARRPDRLFRRVSDGLLLT